MRNRVDLAALSDAALLDAQRELAARRRELDVESALVAAEIDRRSARDRGYDGLAQRSGFLSSAALIQSITGGSRSEAARLVSIGSALDTPVGEAVLSGALSIDAAAAIQRGLGDSGDAAVPLISVAPVLTPEELFKRARGLRDELDASAVARREKEQRDLRYLRYSTREDGAVGGSFLFDAVDGALFVSAMQAILSPRRGGPRFADPEQRERDDALVSDERTTDQLAADSVIAMVSLAIDVDPGTLFGQRRPAVRVVVTADRAILEDSGEFVSMATVERFVCDAGVIPVKFDNDGQVLNVGRAQRLFTDRQRVGLAARDGGCRFPGCDRPPSWCEAHHINQWAHGGSTDLADGVLLCRRHHLLVHNNKWQISRNGGEYMITPPGGTPTPMPSKSRLLHKRVG